MSSYPNTIYAPRTKENKAGIIYDPTKKTIGYVEDVVFLDNEVVALETELGLLPKATSASVQERLKGIRSLSDALSDVLVVKGSNVGIGTTDPSQKLHVYSGTTDTALLLESSDATINLAMKDNSTTDIFAIRRTGDDLLLLSGGDGNVGIGTTIPTAKLDINSDIIRLRTAKTPATSGATGNAGDICWDSNFIYICISTNTWKKVAIATW